MRQVRSQRSCESPYNGRQVKRSQALTLFGVVLLIFSPFVGEAWESVRALALIFLMAAASLKILAVVPPRRISIALAVCSLALWTLAMRVSPNMGHQLLWFILVNPLLVIGIVSLRPEPKRRLIYLVYTYALAITIVGYAGHEGNTPSDFLCVSILAFGGVGGILNRWKVMRRSPLSALIETLHSRSQEVLAFMEEPLVFRPNRVLHSWAQLRLEAELSSLSSQFLGRPEAKEEIVRICLRYPRLRLAWELAYLALISTGDFQGALALLDRARQRRFDDAHFYRARAYALFCLNDRAWQQALDVGWAIAEKSEPWFNAHSYYAVASDPGDILKSTTPMLRPLALRLGLCAPPPVPVIPPPVLIHTKP